MACIGVRGRGFGVMKDFAAHPDCDITHICDVNESVRNERGTQMKELTGHAPKLVTDFRELLDDDSIDAFMVATPDHWHAPASILALDAGKHVYVEKPCCHNVREGRLMHEAVKRSGKLLQVGTQTRSSPVPQEGIQQLKEETEEVIRNLEDEIRKAREARNFGVAEEEHKIQAAETGLDNIDLVRDFFGLPQEEEEPPADSAGEETQIMEGVEEDVEDETQVLRRPPIRRTPAT